VTELVSDVFSGTPWRSDERPRSAAGSAVPGTGWAARQQILALAFLETDHGDAVLLRESRDVPDVLLVDLSERRR
jgi:hypothetical protein